MGVLFKPVTSNMDHLYTSLFNSPSDLCGLYTYTCNDSLVRVTRKGIAQDEWVKNVSTKTLIIMVDVFVIHIIIAMKPRKELKESTKNKISLNHRQGILVVVVILINESPSNLAFFLRPSSKSCGEG